MVDRFLRKEEALGSNPSESMFLRGEHFREPREFDMSGFEALSVAARTTSGASEQERLIPGSNPSESTRLTSFVSFPR